MRTRDSVARAAEPAGRRGLAAAVRVVVSPTFTAGLGVVIAAALVYPTSRSVWLYTTPVPYVNPACQESGCSSVPGDRGSLASENTQRLPTRRGRQGGSNRQPTPAPSASPGGRPPSGGPILTSSTVWEYNGYFSAEFTITPAGPIPDQGWELHFAYPSEQIVTVYPGRWQPEGKDAGLLAGPNWSRLGWQIRVWVVVAGHPAPPRECVFDGRACAVRAASDASFKHEYGLREHPVSWQAAYRHWLRRHRGYWRRHGDHRPRRHDGRWRHRHWHHRHGRHDSRRRGERDGRRWDQDARFAWRGERRA